MLSKRLAIVILALAVTAVSSGCAIPLYAPPPGFEGPVYTRVTLKPFRGTQIAQTNFILSPGLLHAGSPAQILGFNAKHFLVDIAGIRYFLTPEQGQAWNLALAPQILDKYFSRAQPVLPPSYATLVMSVSGVPGGLTKEDVLTLLGYPAYLGRGVPTTNLTREQILGADEWFYYLNVWRVRTKVTFVDGRSQLVAFGR